VASQAQGMGAFAGMAMDSPFMCPPWPAGGMPDFFGGTMPPFQMPPQLFGSMPAPFFAQPPPFFPGQGANVGAGLMGAGFMGVPPKADGDAVAADAAGEAPGGGGRKSKVGQSKRARTGGAKGEGEGGGMRRMGSVESGLGTDQEEGWAGGDGEKKSAHKQRFVWTAELHRRFEVAVNSLGIENAKPQAISQLMNVEGCNAPTRQNIKSHLQKYRLLLQKRARNAQAAPGAGAAAADTQATAPQPAAAGGGGPAAKAKAEQPSASQVPAPPAAKVDRPDGTAVGQVAAGDAKPLTAPAAPNTAAAGSAAAAAAVAAAIAAPPSLPASVPPKGGSVKVEATAPVATQPAATAAASADADAGAGEANRALMDQQLKQQEMNLKVQLDLQAKLHRHLLMQRQLQHQLEVICHGQAQDKNFLETPRGQATLALRNDLRQQLTKAVSMQQEMLSHLDSIVQSDPAQPPGAGPATSVACGDASAAAGASTVGSEPTADAEAAAFAQGAASFDTGAALDPAAFAGESGDPLGLGGALGGAGADGLFPDTVTDLHGVGDADAKVPEEGGPALDAAGLGDALDFGIGGLGDMLAPSNTREGDSTS